MAKKKVSTLDVRLAELLEQRGVNASELSRTLGVTPAAVWNWLQGRSTPRAPMQAAIAKALAVDLSWLVSGAGTSKSTAETSDAPRDLREVPLELLIRAIAAKGFDVTVRPAST